MPPRLHIYIAEDNLDDQTLMQLCLGDERLCPVHFFTDGEELIDYCQEHEKACFVLLLDLKMPRVDGFEVLSRLKRAERLRCNPVIVLSSSQEPVDIRRAYELGANAYLEKPRDLAGYRRMVHCIREFWVELNKAASPA